jgi:predicted metal-dependent phosphoesterase TrpH
MFRVDLHAHTRFFHGFPARPTPFDPLGAGLLARWSRWHDLDAVALTNHDYYTPFDAVGGRPRFVPGIEVSTTAGHLLVVGPDPPRQTDPGQLTPAEVVERAHERGCAVVIPHPFRRSRVADSGVDVDAVELNGKHPEEVDEVLALSKSLDVPVVGGSDAHYPFEAGRAFTRIDAPVLTPAAVVDAIRAGRVEPAVRESGFDRLLQTGYRYVHRFRPQ